MCNINDSYYFDVREKLAGFARKLRERAEECTSESRTRHPKNMSITDLRSRAKLTMRDAAMLRNLPYAIR